VPIPFFPASNSAVLVMATSSGQVDDRIRDLAEREKECARLFEEIKKGNGEQSPRYLELRDSCRELRNEIFRRAKLSGLTRENVKKEMAAARKLTTAVTREK